MDRKEYLLSKPEKAFLDKYDKFLDKKYKTKLNVSCRVCGCESCGD